MNGTALRVSKSNARPWSRARRGFSIIELAVCLVLVGVIAGMAMPRVNYERYRAESAARITRAVLQTSQRQAIMRQTNMLILFDIPGRRMQIVADSNNNYAIDAGERVRVQPLEEGAQFVLPSVQIPGTPAPTTPVSGPALLTISGKPAVAFLRDGASSSDLNIYICSARCKPENQRGLTLTQASGRTEGWRFNGVAWWRQSL